PLLWPIAEHAGLDIIHFGIIFTVNLAIGMFTPPFGLNIFVSVSIFRENTAKIVMGLIPFFIAYLVALGLITYFPALSLTLPNMLMK
ncbi:TRAP transporter large permease subunit, partial [Lacisediminimonas sp.]|uniref:TRAP transporter large permease subunit n=1 Tax=Lacisediminimonas sp. TaxID=3060582 RepID=UPI002715EC2F